MATISQSMTNAIFRLQVGGKMDQLELQRVVRTLFDASAQEMAELQGRIKLLEGRINALESPVPAPSPTEDADSETEVPSDGRTSDPRVKGRSGGKR